MAPGVHLAIGVSPLLRQFVPRFRFWQQLRHCALAQTKHIPGRFHHQVVIIIIIIIIIITSITIILLLIIIVILDWLTWRTISGRCCELTGVLAPFVRKLWWWWQWWIMKGGSQATSVVYEEFTKQTPSCKISQILRSVSNWWKNENLGISIWVEGWRWFSHLLESASVSMGWPANFSILYLCQ